MLGLALLLWTLLLLQQFVEPNLLFMRQHFAKLFPGSLGLFPNPGCDELARPLLAFLQDLVNSFTLLGGEIEFALNSAQEFTTRADRGDRLERMRRCRVLKPVIPEANRMFNQ